MTDIQDLSGQHTEGHISLSKFPEFCTSIPQPNLVSDTNITIQWQSIATVTIHTRQVLNIPA